ncbi:ABC transporter permease [Streptomyces sp. cmx-18-6]|uniref:ABC transporter permease n=1 Tax=Streptomyces sp. cmx-18-6 TaxID=2790930 RepID=UPI0039810217
MSTTTLTTPPKPDTAKASPPTLRGSVRVLLRVHRRSLWAAGVLLLLAAGVVPGLMLWVRTASWREQCPDGDVTPCDDDTYMPTFARTSAESYLSLGGGSLLVLACLVGAFVAGPLIARELESGTFRMAWAQSVSPARWLAARLVVPAVLAGAAVSVLTLVYRWGRDELRVSSYASGLEWLSSAVFPGIGPVAAAYTLLGVAVGALCAVLIRRTLLSMAVTAAVLGLVMTGFGERRQLLWPTERSLGRDYPGNESWATDAGMLTASGKEVRWEDCTPNADGFVPDNCMQRLGGVEWFTDYHPASHFWPLQLVETGILLALAALAVFAAFRILRRRHG